MCSLGSGRSADRRQGRRGTTGRRRQARRATLRRSPGRVPDDGHRLDDRARGDLAEGDGVEELAAGHPVVGDHGVVLHEGDDHEPASVGERADLERHPGQRTQAADGNACARRPPERRLVADPMTSDCSVGG